jgi:multidrug efflux system outer membrane protein
MKPQEFFTDTKLQRVVALALQNNRDLRVAAADVARARAIYRISRADLFPLVAATGSGTRQRVPTDVSIPGGGGAGFSGLPTTYDQVQGDIGFSAWELDFFGRVRSLATQALQEYLATEQARRSAQVLLVSEVASAYLTLAADHETLQLAQSTLKNQEAAYNLVQQRLRRGLVPALDLYRAQTQVDAARGDIAQFTQLAARDENALNLLVGAPVPEAWLPAELGSVSPMREVTAGLSSEVLLGRPDVLAAEDQLKAANADIGAARANFFPRISLTAAIGTASPDLSGLFKAGSLAWSYTPQVVLPVFDPRTWAGLKAAQADKQSAVAQYEKAVQTAFREVADALAIRGTVDRQVAAEESLVHAAGETYRLSTARYLKGVDSYLSVLDAQEALYAAEQRLVSLRLSKLTNQVRLYAVLGGGWQTEPPGPTTAPTAP